MGSKPKMKKIDKIKKNSRRKGKAGELQFIKFFKDVTGVELKRNYDQAASGGHDVEVISTDKVSEYIKDNYAIEIKRWEKINNYHLIVFWAQARRQAKKVGKKPLLAYRQNYDNWRILYPLLYDELKGLDGTATMSIDGFIHWIKHKVGEK